MGSALVYVLVVGAVAAVVYLATSLLAGRGEELAPMPPGATPTRLPARDLLGSDVRGLRFQQAFRGYRMSEVDWALDRLAAEVDTLRSRLAVYEGPPRARDAADAVDDPEPDTVVDPSPTDPTVGVGGAAKGPAHGNA
ncbi:DivIVA domain-containing protein [Actinomycetospora sp. CA-084318]|uniref:DivIVA domain-containing protein n=1 Tax=Actinomycetospora sp. CA-084318 TaxID=3239892 RepID=UPI003D996DF9